MSSFATAFQKLMVDEGGDRPDGGYWKDPRGGVTKYGITQKFLDDRGIAQRVEDLTREAAREIYQVHVWDEYRMDGIADQDLADEFLSMVVVAGPSPATKCLQRALCALRKDPQLLKDDGVFGTITRHQLDQVTDLPCGIPALQAAFRSEQAGYFRDIDDPRNEKGWVRRAYR